MVADQSLLVKNCPIAAEKTPPGDKNMVMLLCWSDGHFVKVLDILSNSARVVRQRITDMKDLQ